MNLNKHVWISEQFNNDKSACRKIKILGGDWENNLGRITIEEISNDKYEIKINRTDLHQPIHKTYHIQSGNIDKTIKEIALNLKFC